MTTFWLTMVPTNQLIFYLFLLQGARIRLVNSLTSSLRSHEGGCIGSSCRSSIDWMLHLLFYPDKSQVCYCDFTAGFLISFLLISNEICAHCETEQQKVFRYQIFSVCQLLFLSSTCITDEAGDGLNPSDDSSRHHLGSSMTAP